MNKPVFAWKFLFGNSLIILSGAGLAIFYLYEHASYCGTIAIAPLLIFIFPFIVGLVLFTSALRASQRIARRLHLLSEMSVEINRAILLDEDLELIYGTILDYLFRIFDHVKYGSVLVLDDDDYLTFASSRGFSQDYVSNFRLKLEKSFLYQELEGNITEARLISKKTIDKAGIFFRPKEWQYKSVISAPLYANKRLFGLLNLDASNTRTFVPEDVHIVEQFTAQIEVCLLARGKYRHHLERAHVDSLTGLYTRRYFEELFMVEIARAERYRDKLTLALFDADGLKKVNDALGHQAGDRMLIAIADALRIGHRKTDILGRLGGDEFIAVYNGSEPDSMEKNLTSLLSKVEADTILFEGNRVPTAFSFGLACYPDDGRTLEELISVADRNMYAMKKRRKSHNP